MKKFHWVCKLRSHINTLVLVVGLIGLPTAVVISTAGTVMAGTNTYPWQNATCVTPNPGTKACNGSVTYDNWGYATCPTNDTGCMGLSGNLNGTTYGEMDPWGEYLRNCTSYVAWMLSSVNGFTMPFHDDAVNWGADAQGNHYTVNMTPALGSVFWDSGNDHVGWVESVSSDGSQVTYEDYNSNYDGNWGEHTVATSSASGYIHFKDLSSGGSTGWTGMGGAIYSGGDSMASGTTLLPNYYLTSANVQFALSFNTDGNLVLYNNGPVWWLGTGGQNPNRLVMQTDGNLVMYRADNSVVWQSGTGGHPGAYAKLQSDGNFVIYSTGGTPLWQSGTSGHANLSYYGSDRLTTGQQITQNQYVRSADGRYALLLQTDGNAVLYGPGYHVLWQSQTAGAGDRFTMQTDGNLVLYALSNLRWQSGTSGTNTYAVVQSDGNFVVYRSDGFPLWQSNTGGKV